MNDRRQWGSGSITVDKRSGRVRLRLRNADLDASRYFNDVEDAELTREAILQSNNPTLGITLREWGETFLEEHDFTESYAETWRSVVVRSCPFIDYALTAITPQDVVSWAQKLPSVPATRSELRDGERNIITFDRPISRGYAKQALSILRSALNAAKNHDPQLIPANPADDVELPNKRHKSTGKVRTKREKQSRVRLDFLPHADCERIFYCTACEADTGTPRHDIEQLVTCPHVPSCTVSHCRAR